MLQKYKKKTFHTLFLPQKFFFNNIPPVNFFSINMLYVNNYFRASRGS